MEKYILVPLAEGFEEIEAMSIIDILRRAGATVIAAGLGEGPVKGRSDVVMMPDCTLDRALAENEFDMIVLPGGMPASASLRDDPRIIATLVKMRDAGKTVAAICAAPIALDRAGILDGEQFTSYPGMAPDLPKDGYLQDRVVISGKLLTSRGPGTALDFALELVRALYGDSAAKQVADEVLAQDIGQGN